VIQINTVVAGSWLYFQQPDPTLFWLNLIGKKMPQCTWCCSALQFSRTQPQYYNRTYCRSITMSQIVWWPILLLTLVLS